MRVDTIVVFLVGTCVYWAEFAVPDLELVNNIFSGHSNMDKTYGNLFLSHERHFALILLFERLDLLVLAFIWLSGGEAHVRVIVDGVYAIGQHFFESGKVHGVAVAVEKENMIRVDFTNGLLDVFVPDLKASVFWIRRFVHWVVAGNLGLVSVADQRLFGTRYYPWVARITLRNLDPHLGTSILEILVFPEQRSM